MESAKAWFVSSDRSSLRRALWMGISKTEVNLRRLLAAAPEQQNQAKLSHVRPIKSRSEHLTCKLSVFHYLLLSGATNFFSELTLFCYLCLRRLYPSDCGFLNVFWICQYVATLREQLEQLAEERTPEGLPRSILVLPFYHGMSVMQSCSIGSSLIILLFITAWVISCFTFDHGSLVHFFVLALYMPGNEVLYLFFLILRLLDKVSFAKRISKME